MVGRPLRIGNLKLASGVLMAPMVGLSTRPYRILALRHGCALAAGEMLAAEYLVRMAAEERRALRVLPEEHPSALQIVGSRVPAMVDSARMLEEAGATVIDINMGCPVRKIVRGGGGAALMTDLALAARIVCAVRSGVTVPVTVKIRAGWDESALNAPEAARAMEEAGADAVTVHARARTRKHSGTPDPDIIAAVKAAVSVPVIGNGGLRTAADARRMVETTGCDGVMFGRGAIGDVFVFERAARVLSGEEEPPPPSPEERLRVFEEHLRLMVREYGADRGVVKFRKCVPHYLKGVRGAREARRAIVTRKRPEEVVETARSLFPDLRPLPVPD